MKKEDFLAFLKRFHMPVPKGMEKARRVVLIVEDDADFRKAVRAFVAARYDVEIHEAEDGFTAGQKVEELKPDVVILDLLLPGMDGFKVCERIRKDPDLAKSFIVAVSGHDAPENKARIKRAGADLFLSKPLGLSRLAQALEEPLAGAAVDGRGMAQGSTRRSR